ncbi:MAG: VOC family protein [Nibricoccus sp.]
MKIDHLALWTNQLEALKEFYVQHFGCRAGPKYTNPSTDFSSYFLTFTSGARLEIMTKPELATAEGSRTGYAHFALSVGSEEAVRSWTEKLRSNGVKVTSEPRRTGDGYYESVVTDPDGNAIELTV